MLIRAAPNLFCLLAVLFGLIAPAACGADINLALHRAAVSSGPNFGGFQPASLTDGNPGTIIHPLADSGTLGFYYEVDLGSVVHLDRVVLLNRRDGCCPERLSRYGVEIYDDGVDGPGALQWSADVRADGSNSGVGGFDLVTAAADPDGTFAGRYVRVVNRSGSAYSPQLAEIEVYGGAPPVIAAFEADDDTLVAGAETLLRWAVTNATSVTLAAEGGDPVAVLPSGERRIHPAVTTTYVLTATNENGPVSARWVVGVDIVLRPPDLTEFQAENTAGIEDEDGDSADWIEVHNPNAYRLNLEGFHLTDNPAQPEKWTFPATRLPPGGYGLVYASGKDRRGTNAVLHTNFKLDADGDYLALVDRDGRTVLRQFPADAPATARFPKQGPKASLGMGANGRAGFLRPPTPGAANGPAFDGVVEDVQFSASRGLYDAAVEVALSTPTPEAEIRYTTNRTVPTPTNGLVYELPIVLGDTTVLRAAAFRKGWAPTDVATHTFVFPTQVVASAGMQSAITTNAVYGPQLPAALRDLPSLSLVTGATVNNTNEVRTSVEWLPSAGGAGVQVDAGVRLYGGEFTSFAKKNFRLYFRGEYGARRLKAPLFAGHEQGRAAVDEFDQLELRGGSHDMAMRGFYLGNIMADDTLLEMGHLNTHGRFVHLYLDGRYWGVYHLRERWGAAMHSRYLGGTKADYESINGNWNVGGWADPGGPYDGDGTVWTGVKSLRSDYPAIRPWLDVPQYIDFMVLWMFGGSEDEYRCVGPTSPGSGFLFQLNDADGWFCIPTYCGADNRTVRGGPGRLPGDGPGSLFSMLFRSGNTDYRTLLADRIQRATAGTGALTPARTTARLDRRVAEIQRAFLAEAARWGYLFPPTWEERRDFARTNWLARRLVEVRSQFRAAGFLPSIDAPVPDLPAEGVTNGTPIRFKGSTAGTYWFTTDGTDPRLPGGGVSPSAQGITPNGVREVVVPAGARWRWFTDATGLGTSEVVVGAPEWSAANWKHPDFDDRGWSEGPAQLGYGDGDEATVLPSGGTGNDPWLTAYFRRRFIVRDATAVGSATLRLRRDDGAIVYLDGREVVRSSVPTGPVTGTTPGDGASDDGQSVFEYPLDPALLEPGAHVLAVELHQATPSNTDASFDLELEVVRAPAEGAAPVGRFAASTVVKVRGQSGAQWSALTEQLVPVDGIELEPGDVVVAELNYHPPGDGQTEFIELENRSDHGINLRGARFTEGVDFAFAPERDVLLAPRQRLVLVKNLFRFRQQYGIEVPVAGIYAGDLANGGERLTLRDGVGRVLFSFVYRDDAPWPTEADGQGATLVLAQPGRGLDNPAAWRGSLVAMGTPGGSDSVAFFGDPTADEDGDGLPALVEFALGTSDQDPASGREVLVLDSRFPGWIALSTPRRLAADEISLEVEFSRDLVHWEPATLLSKSGLTGSFAREVWGAAQAGGDFGFLRLRAVLSR